MLGGGAAEHAMYTAISRIYGGRVSPHSSVLRGGYQQTTFVRAGGCILTITPFFDQQALFAFRQTIAVIGAIGFDLVAGLAAEIHSSAAALPTACRSAAKRVPGGKLRLPSVAPRPAAKPCHILLVQETAAQGLLEGLAVFLRHQVVEYGIDCRADEE